MKVRSSRFAIGVLGLCLLAACDAPPARITVQNESAHSVRATFTGPRSGDVAAALPPATRSVTLHEAATETIAWEGPAPVTAEFAATGESEVRPPPPFEFDPARTGLLRVQNDGAGGVRVLLEAPRAYAGGDARRIPADPRETGFIQDIPPVTPSQ